MEVRRFISGHLQCLFTGNVTVYRGNHYRPSNGLFCLLDLALDYGVFVWLSFFGFFALFVRLKDIRIDFVAKKIGRFGYPVTRLLSNFCALILTGVILKTAPVVFATSMGGIDGAILPGGDELFRQALSVPLFLSVGLIFLTALIDVLKMLFGLAENEPEQS